MMTSPFLQSMNVNLSSKQRNAGLLASANRPTTRYPGGPLTGAHVLIIDDNPVNLKLTRLTLEGSGYRLTTAASAEAALDLLAQLTPELALVDIELPGMDGLQLIRILRSRPETCHMGVMAVTALISADDERRALNTGCDAFVRKPIDTRALQETAARVLELSRGRTRAPKLVKTS